MPRHTHGIVLFAIFGVSFFFVSACRGYENRGTPLAKVGNRVLGETDFRRHLETAYPAEHLDRIFQDPIPRQRALECFLDQEAVLEKAFRIGLPQDQRFKKAVELAELKMLSHLMTDRNRESILRNSEVPPAAVELYYETHKNDYRVDPGFSFRQVLVYVQGNPAYPDKGMSDAKAKAKAQKALKELRRGKSWDEVAKAYSDDLGVNGKARFVRDGRFGWFAKEVEQAVRIQPIGVPGDVFRSLFGYHIIEVVDRVLDATPKPFEEVKSVLEDRLRDDQSEKARILFMKPIEDAIGFKLTDAGKWDTSLLDKTAVPKDMVLATVGKKPILESDFQWFLEDAFLSHQRISVFGRAGSRQRLLRSFLDMLLLEAKARRDGLDRLPSYLEERDRIKRRMVLEFMQEREKFGPIRECGSANEDRQAIERAYFNKVRTEVGLILLGG